MKFYVWFIQVESNACVFDFFKSSIYDEDIKNFCLATFHMITTIYYCRLWKDNLWYYLANISCNLKSLGGIQDIIPCVHSYGCQCTLLQVECVCDFCTNESAKQLQFCLITWNQRNKCFRRNSNWQFLWNCCIAKFLCLVFLSCSVLYRHTVTSTYPAATYVFSIPIWPNFEFRNLMGAPSLETDFWGQHP